jgi:hypothetical protein
MRPHGQSAWVTRSKRRAFRRGPFGRYGRATCDCWGGPVCTVDGVLRCPRGTRTANGRGVHPPGSGTRLESSSTDQPHLEWCVTVRTPAGDYTSRDVTEGESAIRRRPAHVGGGEVNARFSRPFIPGIDRSRMTRSGTRVPTIPMAAPPFSASPLGTDAQEYSTYRWPTKVLC